MKTKKTGNTCTFKIKYSNSPKICINVWFDIMQLNNTRHMVSALKNVTNFGEVDNCPFGPTGSLKFLSKLHKCIGSAQKVHSWIIWLY